MAAEIVIVGGGVIGLSIALDLLREGTHVKVLEMSRTGQGASFAEAGMLCPGAELIGKKKSPVEKAVFDLGAASLELWFDFANRLEEDTGVAVDYQQCGSLVVVSDEERLRSVRVLEENLFEFDFKHEWLAEADLHESEPGLAKKIQSALFLPKERQVDPRKVTEALKKSVIRHGGQILEQSEGLSLEEKNGEISAVQARGGKKIAGDFFIIAAGLMTRDFWFEGGEAPFYAIKGQACSFNLALTERTPRHIIRSDDVYLCAKKNRLVIGATEEPCVETLETDELAISELASAAKKILPECIGDQVTEQWAGLRPTTPDLAPVIGRSAQVSNLAYASGHHRNGILLAPITAQLLTSLVLSGADDHLGHAFKPDRFVQQA